MSATSEAKLLATPRTILDVDQAVIDDVLRPYLPNCRYMQSASIEFPDESRLRNRELPNRLIRLHARFAIPESCYIADTGHFNSVEFNICFNQMSYLLLAEVVRRGLVPELLGVDYAAFKRKQLADVLILRLESSFRRIINPRAFEGIMRWVSTTRKGSMVLYDQEIAFSDDAGGAANGKVRLCFRDVPSNDGHA